MYQKSEDKDSNTVGTAGAHVEDTPPPEESTTPIVWRGQYIGALFGKPLKVVSSNTFYRGHFESTSHWCDDILGGTNQSNVSFDTENSKEDMTDSHITEQHIFKFYQRQTMLQTTQQIQQLPITSTKKIKNTTVVNEINKILVANKMVVQNESQ